MNLKFRELRVDEKFLLSDDALAAAKVVENFLLSDDALTAAQVIAQVLPDEAQR